MWPALNPVWLSCLYLDYSMNSTRTTSISLPVSVSCLRSVSGLLFPVVGSRTSYEACCSPWLAPIRSRGSTKRAAHFGGERPNAPVSRFKDIDSLVV